MQDLSHVHVSHLSPCPQTAKGDRITQLSTHAYPRTGPCCRCPGLLLHLDHFLTFPPPIALPALCTPCPWDQANRSGLPDWPALPKTSHTRAHGPLPIARSTHTHTIPMHTHAHPHPYLDSPFSTLFPFPPDITSFLQLPPCITHPIFLVGLFALNALIPGTTRCPPLNYHPGLFLVPFLTFVPFISSNIPPPPPSPSSPAPAGIPSLGDPVPRPSGILPHLQVPRPLPGVFQPPHHRYYFSQVSWAPILVFLLSVWTSTATCNPPFSELVLCE